MVSLVAVATLELMNCGDSPALELMNNCGSSGVLPFLEEPRLTFFVLFFVAGKRFEPPS